MKIQLAFFAVAGFILSHASALRDGLNLNSKNLYEQISAQVRAPLRAETSAVRSVIDTMKDLQQKLQSDQLRSTYDATRPLRNSQTLQQSYQRGVPSGNNAPQNIRREEVIQIREHQVLPSPHFTQGVNPEKQFLFNRNSQNIHRQVYQNKQVEKFNQELSYITTQNPVRPQQADNNQQGYIFPPTSKQETVVQRSFKQETIIPKQPHDRRQQPVSSQSLHQQDFNAQRSTSDRNQQDKVNQRFNNNQIQDFNAQRFSNNQNQPDFNAQRLNNNQNQQDFNGQRFNSNQNQQDFNAQRFNSNQNQQDFNAQRFNSNQNQQDFNAQRLNSNQNQQDFNAHRFNNQNQQRQYQSEDRLSSRSSANNEGYRVAIPLQDNRPQIISYDLFNRNIELNGRRSYHASNQLNQAFVNRDSKSEPKKSSERDQQQFRFEANKSNLSSDNVFGQNNQNEKSKYAEVSGPVSEILNVASNIKGSAFNRQQLKTPFTVFNNGHLL